MTNHSDLNTPRPPSVLPQGATLDTRQLFQNGLRQVEIVHGDVRYSLRLTRENKLILTK